MFLTASGVPELTLSPLKASDDDAKTLRIVEVFVRDHQKSRDATVESGLAIGATWIPDRRALEVASGYQEARGEGLGHEEAIEKTAARLVKSGLTRPVSAVRIELRNTKHSGDVLADTTIFTLAGKLPGKSLRVLLHEKPRSRRGKPLPVQIDGRPENIRIASLRIQKFYRLSKTGRPGTNRREPVLSKPFSVGVVEGKPARFELRFTPPERLPEKARLRLYLGGIKTYTGPFRRDILDLNEGRKYEEISPVFLGLRSPPAGREPPPALRRLVEQVQARIRASEKLPQDR